MLDIRRTLAWPLLASIILSGCFLSHEDGPPREHDGGNEHDPRFAGDWLVIGAHGWALIPTTTVYRFHLDGSIEVIVHEEGTYFAGEAGQWSTDLSNAAAPTCELADRWWTEGDLLHIDSECTDGTRVPLVLTPSADDGPGPDLEIVDPEGATGFWEGPQGWLGPCETAPPVGSFCP